MARLPRLNVPGYPVHAVIRGNDRQDIFRSQGDRVFFHRCLVEASRRHGAGIHAYVFMSNHIHLVATASHPNSLARAIQSLGRRYVSYFNYLYSRTGTLWEGRFRSSLVETDRYLLACYRYVEMNPVRAGMVRAPADFPWSSYRCNAMGASDDLVTPHPLFLALSDDEKGRQIAYRNLFDHDIGETDVNLIRYALNKGWALGGDLFCAKLEEVSGRRSSPVKRGRRSKKKPHSELPAELF